MMRFATEAYDQGRLLVQEDLALLLNSGRRTIQRDMSNLKKQEIIIPTRGSIQDIGPTISHKTKIVELYLKGYEYTEIERRTRHTGQSIKRYIIGFSKVVMLHSKGYNPNQIRELTNSTEKVVKEYLDLYQKYGEIREYQTENQVVLPYRGTIHDLGRAITHKKMIIGHFLKNVPTPDISRITDHTEEACDRYIKAYKNVRNLYGRMNQNEIARTLEMSESLVKEYVAIHEEYKKKEEKINDGSSNE
ncbi:MAG: DUF1670 domain-containing protein [Candidatus Methanoperedens sp.]|nr:DUF1670 domain-containing protein [Candidatus Methanoperedens sp.]